MGISVSTWISGAAFLLSTASLIISLRRENRAKRLLLAEKVSVLKINFGDTFRLMSQLESQFRQLGFLWSHCKFIKENPSKGHLDRLSQTKEKLASIRNRIDALSPKADPLVIEEISGMIQEQMRTLLSVQDHANDFLQRCPMCTKQQDEDREQQIGQVPSEAAAPSGEPPT